MDYFRKRFTSLFACVRAFPRSLESVEPAQLQEATGLCRD